MKARIKSLRLENFKGVTDATYNMGDVTKVSGMNGLGKTTIATAWYWLIGNVNYELTSNPNIRPDDGRECVPTVTAVLDIDGREVTISKMQKQKKGKPDDNGISKVTLTNSYEVNAVPMGDRDFKSKMEEYGFQFDNQLACSHPLVFMGQKTADMRKVLFKMASNLSDFDIASIDEKTTDVAELLSDYSFDEISATQKHNKKTAVEQLDSIPNQIIGMEKSKSDKDVAELELAKKSLEEKIQTLSEQLSKANSNKNLDDLKQKKMELQFEMNDKVRRAHEELALLRGEAQKKVIDATAKFSSLHETIRAEERNLETMDSQIKALDIEKAQLGSDYNNEHEKAFDESTYQFDESKYVIGENEKICPTCGRELPEEEIQKLIDSNEERKESARKRLELEKKEAMNRFAENKKRNLDIIKKHGFEKKARIEELQAEIEEVKGKLESMRQEEVEWLSAKTKATEEFDALPYKEDMKSDSDYMIMVEQDKALDKAITGLEHEQQKTDTSEILLNIEETHTELKKVESEIAVVLNNSKIDEQIAELQEKQSDYKQAKADAERILNQLDKVSRNKNELLTEEINSHFQFVKFKMFDYQKNGEYKECCIPMLDGKEFGISTNTGKEIVAELDICNSLQKFFGTNYPVFLDGAESLNDFNLPTMDCQLITLNVTESAELKVEVE